MRQREIDACGTKGGPGSAHIAEIKGMPSMFKRAQSLGIQPTAVAPVDVDVPHQFYERRVKRRSDADPRAQHQEAEGQPGHLTPDGQPGLQVAAARWRQVGVLINADKSPTIVATLRAAEQHYKSRAPPKGQPHPDHNKKATLMAALLNWAAVQDYQAITAESKQEAERINQVLAAMQQPALPN